MRRAMIVLTLAFPLLTFASLFAHRPMLAVLFAAISLVTVPAGALGFLLALNMKCKG